MSKEKEYSSGVIRLLVTDLNPEGGVQLEDKYLNEITSWKVSRLHRGILDRFKRSLVFQIS